MEHCAWGGAGAGGNSGFSYASCSFLLAVLKRVERFTGVAMPRRFLPDPDTVAAGSPRSREARESGVALAKSHEKCGD